MVRYIPRDQRHRPEGPGKFCGCYRPEHRPLLEQAAANTQAPVELRDEDTGHDEPWVAVYNTGDPAYDFSEFGREFQRLEAAWRQGQEGTTP